MLLAVKKYDRNPFSLGSYDELVLFNIEVSKWNTL